MMKNILLLFLWILPCIATAQEIESQEKALLALINDLRTRPQSFLRDVARPYIIKENLDSAGNRYVSSLLRDLRQQRPIGALEPDNYLTRQARAFAEDMGKTGLTGHCSKKLGDLSKRLGKLSNNYLGENCSYGEPEALQILMQLLIDDDVPSLGHRKNLLHSRFTHIGIAIAPHKAFEWNCVMDFAGITPSKSKPQKK